MCRHMCLLLKFERSLFIFTISIKSNDFPRDTIDSEVLPKLLLPRPFHLGAGYEPTAILQTHPEL